MAREQFDIALEEYDLLITDGDFSSTESTLEHQRQLCANNKGDFKENPTMCVGIENYIDDDPGMSALVAEISRQFSLDGMSVSSVKIASDGTIQTNAAYK